MRCKTGATISKIATSIQTSSGNLSVAAFSNSGAGRASVPGALLAEAHVASPGTGYREIALGSSVTVKAGDWLGVSVDNGVIQLHGNTGGFQNDASLGIALRLASAAYPLAASPAGLTTTGLLVPILVGVP